MPETIIDAEVIGEDTFKGEATRVRGESGRFLSKEQQKALDKMEAEFTKNPNVFAALIDRIKNNPTLSIMGSTSAHHAKMAGKAKTGKLLLTRIRNNVIRPMLPEQHQGILDNPLVCGAIDLAIGHALLFIGVEFEDKLPEKIRPYARVIGEATMYSGYLDTFGAVDIEGVISKLLSGGLFDSIKDLVDNGSK